MSTKKSMSRSILSPLSGCYGPPNALDDMDRKPPPLRPVVTPLLSWEANSPRFGVVRGTHRLHTLRAAGAASVRMRSRGLAVFAAGRHRAKAYLRQPHPGGAGGVGNLVSLAATCQQTDDGFVDLHTQPLSQALTAG